MRGFQSLSVFCVFAIWRDKLIIETQIYGNYARTLKVSHGSPGWVKDLISKQGTLIKVPFRDISWNLAAPTPAGRPRGHSIWLYFTLYYRIENGGVFRIDLRCQKLQNSLNLMVILKYQISHWEYLKYAVKNGQISDRGRLAGVWSNHVWRDFPEIVRQH